MVNPSDAFFQGVDPQRINTVWGVRALLGHVEQELVTFEALWAELSPATKASDPNWFNDFVPYRDGIRAESAKILSSLPPVAPGEDSALVPAVAPMVAAQVVFNRNADNPLYKRFAILMTKKPLLKIGAGVMAFITLAWVAGRKRLFG